IHISFDGWTAPNGHGLIGIVVFWCTTDGNFMRALLGIREVKGHHEGTNIAACVRNVLQEYGIESNQIGHYILDNAANNNTAVESLEGTSNRSTRLRCLGHVINLAVKHLYSMEIKEGYPTALGKITEL